MTVGYTRVRQYVGTAETKTGSHKMDRTGRLRGGRKDMLIQARCSYFASNGRILQIRYIDAGFKFGCRAAHVRHSRQLF